MDQGGGRQRGASAVLDPFVIFRVLGFRVFLLLVQVLFLITLKVYLLFLIFLVAL